MSSTLVLGATPFPTHTSFRVWAPRARTVAVRLLDADGATRAEHPLAAGARGTWAADVADARPGDDYLFVLDGARALPDPRSRWQPHGVHGASRVVDPAAFAWTDAAWRGLPSMADHVLYELHVGTFTDAGTFDAVIPHLAELRALGITAIELMPVAEFPGARNWGYDGVHPWAPHSAYGGPEGLRRLVDAAHGVGLAVVLDVVYNHLGPEGNYLGAYGPYFTARYRTPWGDAVNYDDAGSDAVRAFVIDNARHWIREYHVDALRLDAVHAIVDGSAEHVLAALTDAVRAEGAAAGRTVQLIAESDLNDPKVVRPTREHGWGFDAQWSDDLHHALHAALTGETRGYYADFGGVGPVRATLASPYYRAGEYAAHRERRHGASPAGIPRDRFVVCLQNHDQVGNRATGDRIATLASPDAQRAGAALVLCSGYVPLLFMGEEYGETHPFLYFVSHGDAALVQAVREGRRAEFASFGWHGEVPDPQDAATFARSRPDHARRETPAHAAMLACYRDLLALRRAEPALRPGAADARAIGAGDVGALVLAPHAAGERAVCVAFNLGPSSAPLALPPADAGRWQGALTTADRRYGGDADRAPAPDAAGAVLLPPRSTTIYVAR